MQIPTLQTLRCCLFVSLYMFKCASSRGAGVLKRPFFLHTTWCDLRTKHSCSALTLMSIRAWGGGCCRVRTYLYVHIVDNNKIIPLLLLSIKASQLKNDISFLGSFRLKYDQEIKKIIHTHVTRLELANTSCPIIFDLLIIKVRNALIALKLSQMSSTFYVLLLY